MKMYCSMCDIVVENDSEGEAIARAKYKEVTGEELDYEKAAPVCYACYTKVMRSLQSRLQQAKH